MGSNPEKNLDYERKWTLWNQKGENQSQLVIDCTIFIQFIFTMIFQIWQEWSQNVSDPRLLDHQENSAL